MYRKCTICTPRHQICRIHLSTEYAWLKFGSCSGGSESGSCGLSVHGELSGGLDDFSVGVFFEWGTFSFLTTDGFGRCFCWNRLAVLSIRRSEWVIILVSYMSGDSFLIIIIHSPAIIAQIIPSRTPRRFPPLFTLSRRTRRTNDFPIPSRFILLQNASLCITLWCHLSMRSQNTRSTHHRSRSSTLLWFYSSRRCLFRAPCYNRRDPSVDRFTMEFIFSPTVIDPDDIGWTTIEKCRCLVYFQRAPFLDLTFENLDVSSSKLKGSNAPM